MRKPLGKSLDWRMRTARTLSITDAFVIVWALSGAYILRFGLEGPLNSRQDELYLWLSAALALAWWLLLGAWNSRQSRLLGSGPDEYKRVAAATLWLFGLIAILSYVFRVDTARGFVGIAFPVGLIGLITARWICRKLLTVHRQNGHSMSRLLLVGGPGAVSHLAESLKGAKDAGYLPIAAYMPGARENAGVEYDLDLPVLGTEASMPAILQAIETSKADTVAVSAGVHLNPRTLRQLGWELAARNIGLIMAPALTDIAGPRIHMQPVAGLPLIHVTTPSLEGGQRIAKRLFDITFSLLLIVATVPLMLVIALLVKLDSRGPLLFRQERIGKEGEAFHMLKFRSMVADAEAVKAALAEKNEGSGVLFKIKDDPRVTRVGRVLRKYSMDELPQLFNILAGSMSVVGPRPPLPKEVAAYEQSVRRRLLVKPGLTGLWQVSGRSDLSWQDSVRLDLYYVENWSLAGDLVIILRTVRAVLGGSGAY